MFYEIYKFDNSLQKYESIAKFEKNDRGIFLEYDMDYVFKHIDNEAEARVSLGLDCSFEFFTYKDWPAFILDLMPSGNGKRFLLEKYGRGDDDFLIQVGAWNPIGNLRVTGELTTEFIKNISGQDFVSFTEDEIIQKNENFLAHAKACGVQIDGATDVQGDAPKFLVAKDSENHFYVDSGLLPSKLIQEHFIVKFPRGKTKADLEVLKNEAAYYEVARNLALNTGKPLIYKDGALFIPRFDRQVKDGKRYCYGLESLYSTAQITQRGQISDNFLFCELIAKYSTSPEQDIIEFLKRDLLNVLLGNPDNHGRNSAMLKKEKTIRLSPLYDFAPMFHDPNDIFMRRSIWFKHEQGSQPHWREIVAELGQYGDHIYEDFCLFIKKLKDLEQILRACDVDEFIIKKRLPVIKREMKKLEAL
ncbi:HipA domain-containing protein [Lentisphaera profundi]|uniref:HipA domain-containing protein n=1 Tax=Lentisphaera profundi TaxID=1658616 RepID=A0ABY7VV96_9BACT|nr:HipA domain-containing protein [Lentisphaera profundi]WDE95983.1 HipA domain-containing protein [Lentisphaera profundi]